MSQETKEKLMHISSASPAVSKFEPEKILTYWKQLSIKDEKIELLGCEIPSVCSVNRNEMLIKETRIKNS